MKTLNSISLIILCALMGFQAQGESLNPEYQNMVIERMDRILSRMEKTDSSWIPSNLRLADLLAERARLRFMQEVEAGCKDCKGSVSDRKRALSIFESILPGSKAETQGAIFFQMGHLYQIAGESEKASSLFKKVLYSRPGIYSKDVVIRARTSLADLYFETGKLKEALTLYTQALAEPQTGNRGLITYRIAWCQFNLTQLKAGTRTLEKLARTPSLLTKDTAEGPVADSAFQNDVLRDLATFYSRQTVTNREINKFQALVPESMKKELLFFFASEVDRLGQKKSAAQIFQAYLQIPGLTKEEQLEVMILLAQATYDKGNSNQSVENFALAAESYRKISCKSDNPKCQDLQKRMKYFITELHRSKKVKPDMDLLKAYQIYVDTFPQDTETSMRGAIVADQLNQPATSARLFHLSADTATTEKMRTESLMGEISSAEKSNQSELKEKAYKHYLSLMPKGPKNYEVRYQLAQLTYEKKKFSDAADEFKILALDATGDSDLRKKSADLALDCLATEKRDSDIEKWGLEFAKVFPQHRVEFEKISRKALINQVASTANNAKSSQGELEKALERLQAANLTTASDSERTLHYKNMLVLAEKVEEDQAVQSAIAGLLSVKSFSENDREATLARGVAYFEKKLDFKSAYHMALRMKFPSLRKAEKELRLGTLADLAGLSPRKHYDTALRLGLSSTTEISVRERLILLSANPARELKKHQNALMRSPQVLSDLILRIYSQQRALGQLNSFFTSSRFAALPAVKFLRAQSFHEKQRQFDAKVARHQLQTQSDRALQKTIQERLKMLSQLDQHLAEALKARDFTGQILVLTTLDRENKRLAQELMKTPMPKGLSDQEQKRYAQLLANQTRPYTLKAQAAEWKLQSIWKNESHFQSLASGYERSRAEIQILMRSELQTLADLAQNGDVRSRLKEALSTDIPTERELLAARENVRKNPENWVQIEKLKNLETKIGHPLMSSYLQGRLAQIQKEKVL